MSEDTLPLKELLFATDFSPISEKAETMTLTLADQLNASVTLLHAIEPITGFEEEGEEPDQDIEGFYEELSSRASERMDEIIDRFREADVPTQGVIVKGSRWRSIIDYAEENDVSMVIVGSHGVFDNGRAYVGTTSHRVLLGSRIPVLLVRRESPEDND